VRQTGRSIYESYKNISSPSSWALQNWVGLGLLKKHFRDFKTGSSKSNFIGHLLHNHSVSTAQAMVVLHIIKKGKHFDSLEKFHMYT
jgi:hypothetical protein